MRNGCLAAIIFVASAALAWSQDPSPPPAVQARASSQPRTPLVTQESLPANDTSQWIAGESYYLGNQNQRWTRAEFLLWTIKDGNSPPLASTGPLGPGTTVLNGGEQNYDPRLGGRFTLGTWLDQNQTKGIEGSFLFLDGPNDNFNASSSGAAGSPVLARPFVNAITGLQDQQLVSFPGVAGGTLATSSSSLLLGGQLNFLCNLCCCNPCCPVSCSPGCGQAICGQAPACGEADCCETACCYPSGYRVDLITGFNYMGLREDLGINETVTVLPTAPAPFVPGQTLNVNDQFETRNNFYGGQIGARGEWYRGPWFVNVLGAVALGSTHQEVRVSGTTVFTDPGLPPVQQPGGVLALPTNSGTRSRNVFTAIPQVGVNVGRQITPRLRLFTGYTAMYWSNVVRPGDQIDPVVNPTQFPTSAGPGTLVGPARPAPLFESTDVWAHGVNFGADFRW